MGCACMVPVAALGRHWTEAAHPLKVRRHFQHAANALPCPNTLLAASVSKHKNLLREATKIRYDMYRSYTEATSKLLSLPLLTTFMAVYAQTIYRTRVTTPRAPPPDRWQPVNRILSNLDAEYEWTRTLTLPRGPRESLVRLPRD